MTLIEVSEAVERIAKETPAVNYVAMCANIEVLNYREGVQYPAVLIVPDGTHAVGRNTTTYRLSLFYVDRLTADLRNEAQVFSAGLQTLAYLVRRMGSVDGVLSIGEVADMQNFTEGRQERLADSCGGAFTSVAVTVESMTICD